MPAVTYFDANKTMAEHSDAVLDYLRSEFGELPLMPPDISWSGMACFYLSAAVEEFCFEHKHLADWEDEENIDWEDV